jgi:hypothetical protein
MNETNLQDCQQGAQPCFAASQCAILIWGRFVVFFTRNAILECDTLIAHTLQNTTPKYHRYVLNTRLMMSAGTKTIYFAGSV